MARLTIIQRTSLSLDGGGGGPFERRAYPVERKG